MEECNNEEVNDEKEKEEDKIGEKQNTSHMLSIDGS